MKIGIIGIGQAGGRIADLLLYHTIREKQHGIIRFALAVDTSRADLTRLLTIPRSDRIEIGQETEQGCGTECDRKQSARITQHWINSITHNIKENVSDSLDAFLIIAGLGGNTGSGGTPVVASTLKTMYHKPVFMTGILPAESEGTSMGRNAAECLKELEGLINGMLLFDNDLWVKEGRDIGEYYNDMNYELVKPLPFIFGANEPSERAISGNAGDRYDIIASWQGIGYAGYCEIQIKSAWKGLFPFNQKPSALKLDKAQRYQTAVRDAATLRLTGICSPREATKAYLILAGPPDELNTNNYTLASSYLKEATEAVEVRGRDIPVQGWNKVAATVLLSGYRNVPRLANSLT